MPDDKKCIELIDSGGNTDLIVRTVAVPTLTHSSETWMLRKEQSQKTERARLKFLRNVPGHALQRNNIRNSG
jgi:hypothetical protein